MRSVAKWVIIIISIALIRVLVKAAFEIGSVKLNDKTYNATDWGEKGYGPNGMKINLPFSLQKDLKLQEAIENGINSQTNAKQKTVSRLYVYTHIDEKSALSIMYGQYNPKVSVNLQGAIEGGYERLGQQLGEQIILNQSGERAIPYTAKQRSISGYEALEADGNVKYKGFQGKTYTVRMLAIKLDHSIYQLQYMYPSLPGYTETANNIFNSVKF